MIYGYIRVSTEGQRDNWSTEVQRERIVQFAQKIGEPYKLYDEVKSGKNIEARPEFQRLLEDLKRDSYLTKNVWVVELTRLTRNVTDGDYICKLFQRLGVRLYINDTLNDLTIAGNRLVYGLQSVVAAHEREQTGERISRSKKEAADKGALIHSALLGYRYVGQEDCSVRWIIDESEAKVVRKIFKDYLEGVSVNQIASELNRLGYKTKRGHYFKSPTIAKILNHPYYFGLAYDSEGGLIPSKIYEPILGYSRDDFLAARAARKPRADKFKFVKQYVSGVITCGRCGRKYYVHRRVQNGKEFLYFAHRMDHNNHCDQMPKYIDLASNAKMLEAIYENSIRDLGFLGKIIVKEMFERPDSKALGEEVEIIKAEIDDLRRRKQQVLDVVESGVFKIQDVKDRVARIDHEIEKAHAREVEVSGRIRGAYSRDEVTEEEAERRIAEFKLASVEDKHRSLLSIMKSCDIEGDTIILVRTDRTIFQWNVSGESYGIEETESSDQFLLDVSETDRGKTPWEFRFTDQSIT